MWTQTEELQMRVSVSPKIITTVLEKNNDLKLDVEEADLLLPPLSSLSGLIVYFLNHCKQMPSVSLSAVICTLIT